MELSETVEAEIAILLASARTSADRGQAAELALRVIDLIDQHSISDVLVAIAAVFARILLTISHLEDAPDGYDQVVLTALTRMITEMRRNAMH